MEFKQNFAIDWQRMRDAGVVLYIAIPMFGGQCNGITTSSLIDLTTLLAQNGVGYATNFLYNESLIPRARNYLTDGFLRSACTHMIFIDADIGFNAIDVAAMIQMKLDYKELDILCGPYPKKDISWEKIKAAVDKGFADENPTVLSKFVGDYVFNVPEGTTNISLFEPSEVLESGTGFMMFDKAVLERFKTAYPELSYKPDHIRDEHFDGTREIHAFFLDLIDPVTKRHLSEDYMFCQYARRAGIITYICPFIKLQHAGHYVFGGSMQDLAQVGQSMTTDVSAIGKKQKK